jgi:hypothetical protein
LISIELVLKIAIEIQPVRTAQKHSYKQDVQAASVELIKKKYKKLCNSNISMQLWLSGDMLYT